MLLVNVGPQEENQETLLFILSYEPIVNIKERVPG